MIYPAAKARKTIQIPGGLAAWIDKALPGVCGASTVKLFSCERLPFVGARYAGITLFNSIYLREYLLPIAPLNFPSIEILIHEFIHIEQFRRQRLFPFSYLANLYKHGYWNHPAEIEARERTDALMKQYVKDLIL